MRKPAFLLSSYTTALHSSASTSSPSVPSTHLQSTRPQPCMHSSFSRRNKPHSYATVASNHPHNDSSSAHDIAPPPPPPTSWPETPTNRLPTPYQILAQPHQAPYSKRRFYELVKLYHPDRNPSPNPTFNPCGVAHNTMLERYRLIIAAHTILSDPTKRSAYDANGAGWSLLREDPSTRTGAAPTYSTTHRWRTDGDPSHAWPVDDDPMFCATWEDWERWYARQRWRRANPDWRERQSAYAWAWGRRSDSGYFDGAGGPQHTIFASNYVFLSLVALLAALGGVGQATRASDAAKSRAERIANVNEETTRQLLRAREDARGTEDEDKHARIRRFLSRRDDYDEGEFDARTAMAGEDDGVCGSGAVAERDEEPFWKRPPENV